MEKLFHIKERGSSVSREIIGGVTTFLAMAYILAVNPDILSKTGMSWGAVFTATAIASAFTTLVMAFVANLPVGLAPGMGLNAFFTYTVCIQMHCSWQLALTAVLVEGIIFLLLSFFGIREAIMNSIPDGLKKAVSVGIGLFITLIGLNNAGIVSSNLGTIIGFVNFDSPTALVGILGLVITIVLYILKVPGSILIGIALTTILGIPFGVTKIPENFKVFSLPEMPHLFAFDFKGAVMGENGFSLLIFGKFFVILFTFLFTDLFDTIGTVAGACLGTSTVTSFVESSSGVAAGARTGFASVVTAILFALAAFLSSWFALIPSAATAPALIFVGFLMMNSVTQIDFKDPTEGIPAFITIMVMPFAYSISKGIAFGMISYVICKLVGKKAKDITVVTLILAIIFIADIIFEAVKANVIK